MVALVFTVDDVDFDTFVFEAELFEGEADLFGVRGPEPMLAYGR